MMLSIISALFMSGIAVSMLVRSHQIKTCRMALLPLAAACMEFLTAGYLTPSAFPWLTVLLIALRLTLASCCLIALQRDIAAAKQVERRKKLARRLKARTVEPMLPGLKVLPEVPYKVA